MRLVAGLWRLAIVALCVTATWDAFRAPHDWVFFTFQVAFLIAFVMLWAGAADLIHGVQPPAWLKGAITAYAAVVAVGAFTVLPADTPAAATQLFGIPATILLYYIIPAMTIIDFLLFDNHRRFLAVYPLLWLIYVPFYITFIIVRAYWWPHSGPGINGSAYPYSFLDLSAMSAAQFGIMSLRILAVFLAAGVIVCIADRALPKQSLVKNRK